ncbi:O-antigen ligase family protein [Bradyrhizobium sp.]|uniref:O-antigen ligase family protein n=1 Tax=Bradyrhizobium sp. TaxID=376 RepID=UPI002D3CC807|nr:O-antigen ligase family protein [Bradyrhizobium sp.]HZR76144.1 O-antigen ligase family protein [Bradyrhizobium sp.]
MSAAAEPIGALLARRWRDPAAWMTTADIVAVLLAASLPWSTSLVGIFGVALVVVKLPTIDASDFAASLKRPICAAPIALFALALVGTLWSDARWGMRFYAVAPTAKLLLLPLLFHHFRRSERGLWVLIAFLASCVALLAMSWIVWFFPDLTLKARGTGVDSPGIFVKNYIDQSQEFALCAVALAFPIVSLAREKRTALALLLAALSLGFLTNMIFVIVSRTALITIPIMLAVFAVLHLRWQTSVAVLAGALVLTALAWGASPLLREKITSIGQQYELSREGNVTSVGERLEFWRKSLLFFSEAPIKGHGTGSTEGLFEKAAAGQTGAAAEVIRNPHNQTLNVAVQWGVLGVIVLYAMWLSHLWMFRGEGLFNWIGLLVVVQNIFTSLFNSHIFDFHEGWMYVLGVGIAGGVVLKASGTSKAPPSDAS